ncbi:MAG TPA: UDP-N-acetylmuramoyl-L-alanine--D-glutamate ligase, partial [Spirochaetia bacterium]|nr:UDP-N-acetylmuramoyl-L-alanine--D-glutamate ligase [Spirochaetia bacterium]
MKLELSAIPGLRVTIMGLGLHGGGTASALFFARHGAQVTVTDLRSEVQLAPSLEQLSGISFRSVLGRHEESDFRGADIVIKNPAVAASSPLLKLARQVESDISVFLSLCKNPLLAVTGTKGKSTTTSAVYETLKTFDP